MRPIDADAIPEEFLGYEFDGKWNGCTIKDLIDEQPTIQPVATDINVGDTISRQQAIDIVVFECGKWTGLAKEISKQLKQLPSAQPEPQEGHWINGKCDLCGEHAPFWCMASTYHESNYCPNCGAKMTTSK